ncbi:MAG: helix-turn-helix transcriptional regulator [Candidatus Omnitrophota bacterium]
MNKTIYTRSHKYIVKQLTAARKEARLKQEDVAKKLSRTQSYISKIESGQCRIDVVQLKELAGIYKKRLDYFIK